MRKLTLTIMLLLLTKTIFADGIILNLDEYLQRYPNRIDRQGWVIIPRGELLDNAENFDINCQYQLHSDAVIEMPTSVGTNRLIFHFTNPNGFMVIDYDKKLILSHCALGSSKRANTGARIIAIKQLSPESIRYANEKRFKSSLNNSEFVELMVSMDRRIKTLEKEVNKSCCEKNCVIL